MAIEGPLRELGIHDVFQLLDLSRKTGVLRVTSELRDDEGTVAFDNGRVTLARIRSAAVPLDAALKQAGRLSPSDVDRAELSSRPVNTEAELAERLIEARVITRRELERHVRQQIEGAVFELMSWSEGYFSFEETPPDQMPVGVRIAVSTESLLMEGARRIDEWSRIADKIPNADVIPELAPVDHDREDSVLDLLPHEWQVLAMIDGVRDLRSIAAVLVRDEFEVAKIAYGLVSTGVVSARVVAPRSSRSVRRVEADTKGRLVRARGHTRAGRHDLAAEELRSALRDDPAAPELHRAMGFAAARVGDLTLARRSWELYLSAVGTNNGAQPVAQAVGLLTTLTTLLDADAAD